MKKKQQSDMPRSIPAEVARWEVILRRDDKQKLRQPLKKKMTPEVYTSWILRQKAN